MRTLGVFALAALAACGSEESSGTIDAPSGVDGAAATVVEVTPCTGETATVTTDATFKYTPMATTINQGQIVKFVMDPSHDVAPSPTRPSDPGLRVGFGATKCLRFTQQGTFNFFCSPHGFTGTITVN